MDFLIVIVVALATLKNGFFCKLIGAKQGTLFCLIYFFALFPYIIFCIIMSFRKPCHKPFRNTLSFFYLHCCKFSLQTFRDCCKVPIRHERINKKIKNFVVRALKTKQAGNACSPRGCQENPTLVKYSNGDKIPTKALYLNTGDKTKSKYSPQKILSLIKSSKPPLVTRIARAGLGTRLSSIMRNR